MFPLCSTTVILICSLPVVYYLKNRRVTMSKTYHVDLTEG